MQAAAAAPAGLAAPVGRHHAPFLAPGVARRARHAASPRPAAGSGSPEGAGGGGEEEAPGLAVPHPPPPQLRQVPPISAHGMKMHVPGASDGLPDDAANPLGKWAEQYRSQLPDVPPTTSGGEQQQQRQQQQQEQQEGGQQQFLLPVMPLSKVKLPTESVPLQIFEPRFRLMFKLVNQSASRRFGVVLADSKESGMMESVGALCELTHFVTVPERRRVFFNARVIGRFQTHRVVSDKPFIAVLASRYCDAPPQGLEEQLQLAATEMRVWSTMQEVRQLASKLFAKGGSLGHEMFSLETRRWAPDAEARASVPTAAGADPTLMQMVELAGLLGDEATLAERTTEYMCSDMAREVGEDERRERFSFALARTLDLGPERLQELMYSQSTAERLRAAEELILEGRNYLAARSTLKDILP